MHYCLLVGIGDGLLAYLVFSLRSVYTLTTLGIIIMVTKTIATYLYSLVNGGLMLVILTSHSPGIAVCSM